MDLLNNIRGKKAGREERRKRRQEKGRKRKGTEDEGKKRERRKKRMIANPLLGDGYDVRSGVHEDEVEDSGLVQTRRDRVISNDQVEQRRRLQKDKHGWKFKQLKIKGSLLQTTGQLPIPFQRVRDRR